MTANTNEYRTLENEQVKILATIREDVYKRQLTHRLDQEGMLLHYDENIDEIPHACRNPQVCMVVYTPAIPESHVELQYFKSNGFEVLKRAQVLGSLTRTHRGLCFAGTHGKTTTSTMCAHIMHPVSYTHLDVYKRQPILCGIFFVESLSVIRQVYYYKSGKRKGIKRRIFKRTPIHDNFRTQDSQLDPACNYLIKKPHSAIHESKITIRFWIITIILAAMTIITLKIR